MAVSIKKIGSLRGLADKKAKNCAPMTEAGKFLVMSGKKNSEYPKFRLTPAKTLVRIQPPLESKIKSLVYPVIKPYAYANVYLDEKDNTFVYNLVEPRLTEYERKILDKLKEGLVQVIDVRLEDIKNSENVIEFLENHVQMLLEEYNLRLNEKEYIKIVYYIYRDFVGFNNIEPLLRDPYIEDIGCLPEHENIFVRINGRVSLTKIGDLIDSEIPGDDPSIRPPSKKTEVVSFNPETFKTEYKKVTGLLRKTNKHGYYFDMRTEGGNHACVSPDHPMLVLDKSGVIVKKADEIENGDYVLKLKAAECGDEATAIDLADEFSRLGVSARIMGARQLIYNNKEVASVLGISNRLVALWKQNNTMPLWAYLRLENNRDIRKSLKISVGQGVKNWLPVVINPDKDFSMFLGLFLAEGYYETSGISLAFGKHEKELQEISMKIGKKTFGTTTSLIEHKTSSVVYCGGKTLRILFEKILGIGSSSYSKKVPDIAYTWNSEMLRALAEGYFLGNGYIRVSDKSKKAVMATASKDLVLGIRYILYKLGIYTRVDKRDRRFANTWEISIENGKNFGRFSSMMNVQEETSSGSSCSELYPGFLFDRLDYSLTDRKVVRNQMAKSGKIGMRYALLSSNRFLQALISGSVHPVKIIDITRVEYSKPFYDIEVEDNKNFMHGDFIFTHNCDGVGIPVYIVHQKFGSIRTNIIYNDPGELREFVIKLAERCDRYISYAEPLLDGTLKDGARVQATLPSDVTTKGPTFSIRKFRETPFSPTDMITLNTLSSEMLAYLWFVVENGSNILIVGGVATGKTSILNAISLFIPSPAKIVSIEDTRELNIPHENWIPGVVRIGFGGTNVGEVTMYELLRESFRQNPDYLIVGEIRGKEAYVMFQGMASGHPSIATMHAGSVDDVMKRLQTKPISLSPGLLDSLDIVLVMIHARDKGKSARRMKEIVEIMGIDMNTGEAHVNKAFTWVPSRDVFEYRGNSWVLNKISATKDINMSMILKDISRRKKLIDWMFENSISDIKEVVKYINAYASNPQKIEKLLAGQIKSGDI